MFEEFVMSKDIISEKSFELRDEEYPEIRNQITLRGWKRLASPRTNVKVLMIKEFFANAARTQEEMDEAEQHPLKSFVRGVEVDFSPAHIRRVMKFKDNIAGSETDYNTRQDSNQMLEEVLRDLSKIANIAQNLKLKGKLGFPSLIYKLCREAKVSFGEYKRNACVNEESTITAKVMETIRGGALPILRRHQEKVGHNEDQHHDED
ncbi:hypothetical protein PIB30_079438 [Stylosanthes scabra]|uniref:Putative plant transposon protein domain-containing protein n=1 Tax=Stylosanthes scabra TaxID=79078 RepID=A0ABU6VPV1_9FABA|nr:hypothetical protein [Stylosanthes scabra]